MLFIVLAMAFVPAQAATVLSASSAYVVKKEIKDAASAPKPPGSVYFEMQMDFESFDLSSGSSRLLMTTHSDQLIKLRKLPKGDPKDPKEAQAIKDGLGERTEMTFERFSTSSKVVVPGLPNMFETNSDLGAFLSAKPILIRGDGKTARKVEGLDEVRNQARQEIKEPMVRATVPALLNEESLLKTSDSVTQSSACLGAIDKKKPGDKWKLSREEQGIKFDSDCVFEGWANAHGKKIAVIKLKSGKQRTMRQQPNGVPAMAEVSGEGVQYFEPESQEILVRMETSILVEPTDEEVARRKAKGQSISRNKSLMKHWSHLYPI